MDFGFRLQSHSPTIKKIYIVIKIVCLCQTLEFFFYYKKCRFCQKSLFCIFFMVLEIVQQAQNSSHETFDQRNFANFPFAPLFQLLIYLFLL